MVAAVAPSERTRISPWRPSPSITCHKMPAQVKRLTLWAAEAMLPSRAVLNSTIQSYVRPVALDDAIGPPAVRSCAEMLGAPAWAASPGVR